MAEKSVKRLQIRLSERNASRIEEMADRYGMSVNSMVSFIVGQWLDNNYDLKENLREKQMEIVQETANKTWAEIMNDPEKFEWMKNMFEIRIEDETK